MAGLLLVPLGVQAAPAASGIGLQVAPARIDLAIGPADNTITRQLSVVNRGTERTTFSVAAVDVVIHDGFPEALPPSSTPYSLAAITHIEPAKLSLDPGKSAALKVAFDVSAHRPLLGALLVIPGQQGQSGSTGSGGRVGVSTLPEALITVSMAPVDQRGELLPAVSLGVDPLSLQVPAMLESGPIVARSTVRDSGSFYERMTSDYTFSAFGHPFLTVSGVPADAMPQGSASTSATTRQRLEASGQTVDTAPWFCVCQVTVKTYATLANRRTVTPVVQTATVIVFPWRLAGALLGLLALLIVSRRLWRRRALHP